MESEKTFFFHFHFRKDFTERGGNPLTVFAKLRELGHLTIVPHTTAIPLFSEYNPKELYLKWTIKLVTSEHQSHIERILLPLTADEKNRITLEVATLPPPDPEKAPTPTAPEEERVSTPKAENEQRSHLPKIITKKIPTPLIHMLVKIGKTIFSIPHSFILDFLTVEARQIYSKADGEWIDFKGKSIRVLRIHPLLRCQPTEGSSSSIFLLIGQVDSKMFALVVDQQVQEYYQQTDQILEDFSKFPLVSGAIDLENDYLAFILNIQGILSNSR